MPTMPTPPSAPPPHTAARQPCHFDGTAEAATVSAASSSDSATTAATAVADHGLTHSEAEPQPRGSASGASAELRVAPGGGGVLVRWDVKVDALLLSPAVAGAGAVAVAGNWMNAVRLTAQETTGTVQLTLLAASFRVYVDGQRLARVGSPVLVRPAQAVRFAADATLYSITTVASSCATPMPLFLRRGPAHMPAVPTASREASSSLSPPPRAPSPAGVHIIGSSSLSASSALSLSVGDPLPTPPPPFPLPPDAVHNAWWETDRVSSAKRPSQVASLTTVAVGETAEAEVAAIKSGAVVTPPGAIANASDLQAVATSGDAWDAGDSIDSVASLRGKTVQRTPQRRRGPSSTTSTTSSSSSRKSSADGGVQRRPPPPLPAPSASSSRSYRLSADASHVSLSWGSVATVSSPDWAAVAARYGEVNRESAEGAASDVDSSCSAFAAAMRSRRETRQGVSEHQPQQQQQQTPPRRSAAVNDDSTMHHKAVSPHRGLKASSSCCTTLTTTSSVSPAVRHHALHRRDSRASTDSAVRVKEKLRLRQRVAVVPFVVEAFGATHRYRPLASVPSSANSTDEERAADTGLTPDSPSELADDAHRHLRRDAHSDDDNHGPWVYPRAADEIVTPHTEGIARRALALQPARTPAAKAASFLHDALLRSYDASADRFTYMHTAGLPELLHTSFMTVTEELLVMLDQGRPVRRLSSPLLCAGDLFGSFKDLLVVLQSVAHFSHWSMLHRPLVLLGNYVDYGWHSVEVTMLLCSWACLQPARIHLLRGPHEDPVVNGDYASLGKRCLRYKCRQRFGAKRGVALWTRLNRLFALLPVAAVVDGGVFLVHGGVPQLLPSPIEAAEGGAGCGAQQRDGSGGGGGRRSLGGALYSNTSGVPTPTSTASVTTTTTGATAASRASSSARLAGVPWAATSEVGSLSTHSSWRSPSARQVLFTAAEGLCDTPQVIGGDAHRCAVAVALPPSSTLDSSEVSLGLLGNTVGNGGATVEKMVAHQLATGSAGDTLALRCAAGPPWDASSSLTSLSTALEGVYTGEAAAATAVSAAPDDVGANSASGVVRLVSRRLRPPAASAGPHLSAAPPTTGDPSLAGDALIYALQDGRARTPLVDWDYESTAPSAASHDAPSVLAYGGHPVGAADSTEDSVLEGGAQTTVSTFTSGAAAATTVTTTGASSSNDDDGCSAHHPTTTATACDRPAGDQQPTELDFEELLRATDMSGYIFPSLQPGPQPLITTTHAAAAVCARRCRLLRELVWNRPRDATARLEDAEESARVVRGAVQPSWWWPREVQCCRVCPAGAAHHRCCHVFGTWGLIHFLDRFHLSLVVRGAPQDTAEMYGAQLAEEGRLLSLLTCTRLRKASLQAAACVVQASGLQLATWGPQGLADSRGQISLSDLPGIRAQREAREQLCRFVHEQVRVRVLDHHQVGPHDRWGVTSAYGEFVRQRALKKRLGSSEHLP